ncbi:MAG: CBS domain-containing protein [Maricaulis sp.]|uniref:CBS domain-containing protein n=1 Tax=Maricaulis sp. TaxID=1486257 RepID=UPI001B0574B1|nr:CBS domain-containing protein [Maricaulis sp.]MBO6730943.1 CBS domain-containing protein [Maricaulis sp.]MBO6848496.1 CBS domain-containing protein [Maricaulis sp.]MBO6877233.1 CBS domain-containing protein [Maricaulis sp.]MDM7985561.1 CBS domain-containing protein [Maricaulis sp.]
MRVENILSVKGRSVVTIEDSCTLREAAQALDANAIGALVVTDPTGRPISVLTERDVVRELAMHGRASLNRTVANATTPAFITATPDEAVEDVLVRMTDRRVRHLSVLEGRELVGIVSIGDAVKARIQDVEAQTAAMREYILS